MFRVLDKYGIADWGIFTWNYRGKVIGQVMVQLFNGTILIMNLQDFMEICSEDSP